MTLKPSKDYSLQSQSTEHQIPTTVLHKRRCSALYDSEVFNQNLVLRMKFVAKNRHLWVAAKRYIQYG